MREQSGADRRILSPGGAKKEEKSCSPKHDFRRVERRKLIRVSPRIEPVPRILRFPGVSPCAPQSSPAKPFCCAPIRRVPFRHTPFRHPPSALFLKKRARDKNPPSRALTPSYSNFLTNYLKKSPPQPAYPSPASSAPNFPQRPPRTAASPRTPSRPA